MSEEPAAMSRRSPISSSRSQMERNHQFIPPTRITAEIGEKNTEACDYNRTGRTRVAISGNNLRDNNDMGDSLQEIISNNTTINDKDLESSWKARLIRVYFQNVNGLWLQDSGVDILETFMQIKEVQADIFGIVETKLNCQNSTVQATLRRCQRQVWEHSKLFTCSSDEAWDRHLKPGGTMIGVSGPLVGRVKGYYNDRYGRWTQVELLGRSGRIVSVICAYQVVQEQGQHGDQKAYSQQVRMMRLEGNLAPDPRRQFINDLKALVKSLKQLNQDILLMGDFNESIGVNPAGWQAS
jgi:exonuclease III